MKRRDFLLASAGALSCLALSDRHGRTAEPLPAGFPPPAPEAAAALPPAALFVQEHHGHRLHAIAVPSGKTLASVDHFSASHAIQLVPGKKRAFVHGRRTDRPGGALIVMRADKDGATVELDHDLPEHPLHWQPRPDLSEIVYNTTGDHGLTIVNTDTLEVESFKGAAGPHSLMGFLDDDVVSSNGLVDSGQVRILDRKMGYVDQQVGVGPWPHGLAICAENGRAYCWCGDGVHVVGVRGRERGRRLKVIESFSRGQRCWFAWTPQGGRLSHDTSWLPGDRWAPYLTVVDAHAERLERIESGDRQPGTLTVSDDGALGLASCRNTSEALVFDLKASRYTGAIPIGASDPSNFFDRDLSIAPGGRWAAVTNPADPSVSVVDLTARREVARLPLAFRPGWMKLLLV